MLLGYKMGINLEIFMNVKMKLILICIKLFFLIYVKVFEDKNLF